MRRQAAVTKRSSQKLRAAAPMAEARSGRQPVLKALKAARANNRQKVNAIWQLSGYAPSTDKGTGAYRRPRREKKKKSYASWARGNHPHAGSQDMPDVEATDWNSVVADLQRIKVMSAAAAASGTIANGAHQSQGIVTTDIGAGVAGRIRVIGIIDRLIDVVGPIRGIGTIDRLVGVVGPILGTDQRSGSTPTLHPTMRAAIGGTGGMRRGHTGALIFLRIQDREAAGANLQSRRSPGEAPLQRRRRPGEAPLQSRRSPGEAPLQGRREQDEAGLHRQ